MTNDATSEPGRRDLDSTAPPRFRSYELRWLAFAASIGVGAALAFVAAEAVAVSLRAITGRDAIPVSSLIAALLLLSAPLAARAGRWARIERTGVVVPLALASSAPLLTLGALNALSEPIVWSHWRCGTGEMMLAMVAPFGFVLAGALGALIAIALFGRERPALDRALGAASLGALGIGALLVAASLIHAARHPSPEAYVASLPVHTVVPPVSGRPAWIVPPDASLHESARQSTEVYEYDAGEILFRRACTGDACDFGLISPSERPAAGGARDPRKERRKFLTTFLASRRDEAIELRRDAQHDLWVLTHVEKSSGRLSPLGAFRGPKTGADHEALAAIDQPIHTTVDVHVRDVAGALAPPSGWITGGALGLALAAGLLARRRRAVLRLGRLEGAKIGVHRGGWVTFDEALPALRAAPDLALPEGQVLVLLDGERAAPPEGVEPSIYRGDRPLSADLVAGPRERVLAEMRHRIAATGALALAVLLLTLAPLVAAWIQGLI